MPDTAKGDETMESMKNEETRTGLKDEALEAVAGGAGAVGSYITIKEKAAEIKLNIDHLSREQSDLADHLRNDLLGVTIKAQSNPIVAKTLLNSMKKMLLHTGVPSRDVKIVNKILSLIEELRRLL